MPLVRADFGGAAILYDPRRIGPPEPLDFEPAALVAAGRARPTAGGRGVVHFVTARSPSAADDLWVLRHYRRGGLLAGLLGDRYLYAGAKATRAFAELTLLAELHEAGLAVPAPVAARVCRRGLYYRADLLTVALPGVRTLAELRQAAGTAPLAAAIPHAVGGAVRRLHEAGVWHADLNAHNVLVDGDGRAYLIDFDRAERRPPGAWREANLARLRRSLDKVSAAAGGALPPADWQALLAGYSSASRV